MKYIKVSSFIFPHYTTLNMIKYMT